MQWRSKFSLNLWATTFLLKQWTLDELMIGLSSGHHGRHQNIPASKMNFFSSKEFFLLSFLFRNCVSLNPLLWLCFKNCFCQRHNAPNDHTCLCQQISESFFWSERKKRRDWRYSTGYKHYQYKNNQKFYQHFYQTKTSEKNTSWFICKILYSYNGFLVYGCRICCYSH